LSDDRNLCINKTILNALYPPNELLDKLSDQITIKGCAHLWGGHIVMCEDKNGWKDSNQSLYSFLLEKLMPTNPRIMKIKSIKEDLLNMLIENNIQLASEFQKYIINSKPSNVGKFTHMVQLSEEVKAAIREREAKIYSNYDLVADDWRALG
jgi:hypothetical protein